MSLLSDSYSQADQNKSYSQADQTAESSAREAASREQEEILRRKEAAALQKVQAHLYNVCVRVCVCGFGLTRMCM